MKASVTYLLFRKSVKVGLEIQWSEIFSLETPKEIFGKPSLATILLLVRMSSEDMRNERYEVVAKSFMLSL